MMSKVRPLRMMPSPCTCVIRGSDKTAVSPGYAVFLAHSRSIVSCGSMISMQVTRESSSRPARENTVSADPRPSAFGAGAGPLGVAPPSSRSMRATTKRKQSADAVAPAASAAAANSIASVRQLPYTLKVAATQQRIEARISADEKRLLEDAAQRRGMTLTAFVLSTAHDAAVRTLETAHVVELTRQDQQRFVDTLLNPPAPSERLRATATDYREHTPRATHNSRR